MHRNPHLLTCTGSSPLYCTPKMKNTTTISTSAVLPSHFTLHPPELLVFPTYLTTLLLLLASVALYLLQSDSDPLGKKPKTRRGRLPPGPKPWPVVGNLPEVFMKKPTFRWILGLMKEMDTRIACVRVGGVHIIPVTCPELAREFLKNHDAAFADRPLTMGTHYISRGFLSIVVTPRGDQWKKMRRVVASEVINPARLRWLLKKRTEEADNLVRHVYSQCTSTTATGAADALVDVRVAARHYSANIIRKMMFGRRHFGEGRPDGGPGLEEEEHVEALFTVLSLIYVFNASDYVPALRCLDLDGHERTMKRAIKIVNKYHEPIIDQRIQQWRSGLKEDSEDLLDVLIAVKDDEGRPLLTTEEIKAQTTSQVGSQYLEVDSEGFQVQSQRFHMSQLLRGDKEKRRDYAAHERLNPEEKLWVEKFLDECVINKEFLFGGRMGNYDNFMRASDLSDLLFQKDTDSSVIDTYVQLYLLRRRQENPSLFNNFDYLGSTLKGYMRSKQDEASKQHYLDHAFAQLTRGLNEVDQILSPMHFGTNHWALLLIHMKRKEFQVYDSLRFYREDVDTYVNVLKKDLQRRGVDATDWPMKYYHTCPQQGSGDDCAIFTCKYMECLARADIKGFDFTKDDIPYVRATFTIDIIKEYFKH